MTSDLLLPERARLFYIGPPKTASTAVQQRAAAHRTELLDHGVRYPGRNLTQRREVAAFVGRSIGWVGTDRSASNVPPRRAWDAMMEEIDSDQTSRILFGHEYAAAADDEMVQQFVSSIGPRLHVAITLRDYGSMLPSIWQEYCKAGNVGGFDDWMRKVVERPRTAGMTERFFGRHDQGELVRRWARAAGPDNVTVIVLDPADHDFVYNSFERLLGLPLGLLNSDAERIPSNRGMTATEIALMIRFNAIVKGRGAEWREYQELVANGAVPRMLETRSPSGAEARLRLPDWSVDVVNEDARRHVNDIAASGVRVVGDLQALAKPVAARRDSTDDYTSADQIPVEAAAQALAGMMSAAMGRGWDFSEKADAPTGSGSHLKSLPARDLVRELSRRMRRRARSRLSRKR